MILTNFLTIHEREMRGLDDELGAWMRVYEATAALREARLSRW